MRYAPKAEPARTTNSSSTSAIYNHPGRLFCTGGTGVVGGCVCLGAWLVACGAGTEGSGGVAGIGVLAEMARGGCDIRTVGM